MASPDTSGRDQVEFTRRLQTSCAARRVLPREACSIMHPSDLPGARRWRVVSQFECNRWQADQRSRSRSIASAGGRRRRRVGRVAFPARSADIAAKWRFTPSTCPVEARILSMQSSLVRPRGTGWFCAAANSKSTRSAASRRSLSKRPFEAFSFFVAAQIGLALPFPLATVVYGAVLFGACSLREWALKVTCQFSVLSADEPISQLICAALGPLIDQGNQVLHRP